jgi:hypothetical protein
VAGCDAGATRGHQGLGQVHLLVLEQVADLLRVFLQALLGQELREGDVRAVWDMARFDACGGRAGGRDKRGNVNRTKPVCIMPSNPPNRQSQAE